MLTRNTGTLGKKVHGFMITSQAFKRKSLAKLLMSVLVEGGGGLQIKILQYFVDHDESAGQSIMIKI